MFPLKKIVSSLPFRLILGVVLGIVVGIGCAGWQVGDVYAGSMVMQVVQTVKNLLGSLINFCVPLIIIGFIAPSITRLRSNASRMLPWRWPWPISPRCALPCCPWGQAS